MSQRVLITGASGYIGTALTKSILGDSDFTLCLVDNDSRKRWVQEVGGCSLTKYSDIALDYNYDLTQYANVNAIVRSFRPQVVIHLASQPSAPYAEKSFLSRTQTQVGNLKMLVNILYSCKENNLSTRFIVTTTTGIPGAPSFPITESPMANLGGSSYHISRGFDSANMQLLSKQWKLPILEMRTAIVYGTRIDHGHHPCTRLDWDFYFGTVVHRFIVGDLKGESIPIYGKGLQRKPIIALRDVVRSIHNALEVDIEQGHRIVNQVTECRPIIDIAEIISSNIKHVPNPRVEKEDHPMIIKNDGFFRDFLNSHSTKLEQELPIMREDINVNLLPEDWKKSYWKN